MTPPTTIRMSSRPRSANAFLQGRDQGQVPGGERADADDVHVVVDGLLGRLLRRLEQRADVDVEAQIGERRGDDLLAAVVAVLAELGDQDARPTPFTLEELLDLLCDLGRRRSAVCRTCAHVDPGAISWICGLVAAEDLLQGVADLAHRRLDARRLDGQLQQVALAALGALGQGVERRATAAWSR